MHLPLKSLLECHADFVGSWLNFAGEHSVSMFSVGRFDYPFFKSLWAMVALSWGFHSNIHRDIEFQVFQQLLYS